MDSCGLILVLIDYKTLTKNGPPSTARAAAAILEEL